MRGKDICWGKVQDLIEVLNDENFLSRKMVVELKDEKGKNIKGLGIPVKLSETPGSVCTSSVGFGESTKKVLEELGYTKREIEECFLKKVV